MINDIITNITFKRFNPLSCYSQNRSNNSKDAGDMCVHYTVSAKIYHNKWDYISDSICISE